MIDAPETRPAMPAFRQAVRYWLRLGCISFGGPAGQIAVMHRELVEQRRWISERHFLQAVNFCMLLPGPEAQQLATYLGWRLHGWRGGVAAGGLFVLPSVLLLYGLSWLFVLGGHLPEVEGIFQGLNAAVVALVAEAGWKMGRRVLTSPVLGALAAGSWVAIHFFNVSFVFILLAAALIGVWSGRLDRAAGGVRDESLLKADADGGGLDPEDGFLVLPAIPKVGWRRNAGVVLTGGLLWWIPVLLAGWVIGWGSTVFLQGLFFSKAAVITFGGAYAVLPYVAQQAVEHYQWLDHGAMMSGLALAETTPGPLIMVLQFVGFVGGWNHPGVLSPWLAATAGALITTWATFIPSFLFVFLGAPYVANLHRRPAWSAALAAITAAVVGVIVDLALVFTRRAVWPEGALGPDGLVAVLALAAWVALRSGKVPLPAVLAVCAVVGWARQAWAG
ncbi:MAG: chromate transporter [Verrucomicrobiales bacterium]|nr:chromate transporter [Verrucomicrobiales bacterium]